MSNIVRFTGVTSIDCDPNLILKEALEAGLESVIVIGYRPGEEEYTNTSIASGEKALWLL